MTLSDRYDTAPLGLAYHEAVAHAQELVRGRDEYSFALGFHVRNYCPLGEQRSKSVRQWAADLHVDYSTLFRLLQVVEFWADMDSPEDATWWRLSDAMRRAGYRANAEITPEMRQHATEILYRALDDGPERKPPDADALVEQAVKKLERVSDMDSADPAVRRRVKKALLCLLTGSANRHILKMRS